MTYPLAVHRQAGMGAAPSRKFSSTSDRRFSSNRPHFAPSRSPPTPPLSCSPSFFPRSNRNQYSDESRDDSNRSYEFSSGRVVHRNYTLPSSAIDPQNGQITYSFERILDERLFEKFVKDKAGCHYLQESYPAVGSALRARLLTEIEQPGFFEELSQDVFANFFVQRLIEEATDDEQSWVARAIGRSMFVLCMNRYSCRVVQKAIETLPESLKVPLLEELAAENLVMLTVDQNANHVIQKIFSCFDLCHWSFIITALIKESAFFQVVENKYGCRVIQLAIELLSSDAASSLTQIEYENKTLADRRRRIGSVVGMEDEEVEWATVTCGEMEAPTRSQLLRQMMARLVEHCERLSANEYANYIIQHVITSESLSDYRELIIERCLLCKLLSMAQEKYASHVVEKALEHANPRMLKEMMDEIFDGYVPHPETKKDALDILLFHQFGNYVVQRMLTICLGIDERKKARLDESLREHWLARLETKINYNDRKLLRYSSGKKILDMLRSVRGAPAGSLAASTRETRDSPPRRLQSHDQQSNNNMHHAIHRSYSNPTYSTVHGYGSPQNGGGGLNGLRIPDQYR